MAQVGELQMLRLKNAHGESALWLIFLGSDSHFCRFSGYQSALVLMESGWMFCFKFCFKLLSCTISSKRDALQT